MIETRLISLFYEYLSSWSWEEWQAAGSSDREEIVINALAELGPKMDIDEAYDLFYDWAAGLTPEDFDTENLSEKLSEWVTKDGSGISISKTPAPVKPNAAANTSNAYRVTYYEDGVKKSFIVHASSSSQAEQIAWSNVDADSLSVSEISESLDEAIRVVSDPDILYHATEAEPLYKIFTEDCLKGSVNTHAGINAVCLTTDAKYTIYGYPCKIQLSRQKLLDDGYEFIPYDEFADDPDCTGESEERVQGDIKNISKYVTAIYIDWTKIPIAQSAKGAYISGPEYDEENNEGESWNILYHDFRKLLSGLKAKGIRVLKKGKPMHGKYYLDDAGVLQQGDLAKIG